MYRKHELTTDLAPEDIADSLKACGLAEKDEYMEDEADRFRECRTLIEKGKTYKQATAHFRRLDKLKQTGDTTGDPFLEVSELLAMASELIGGRISLTEAGKILAACDLPDKEEYTSVECDRFIEACTLINQQGKTYEEVAEQFGVAYQGKSNAHSVLLDEVRQLLSQPAFSQAEQIREALPQMAVEQLEEIKALFWQMTAQRLRQYVDSGQLEAEIRQASKSVLATSSGKHLGLLPPNNSPNQKRLPG